MAGDPMVANGRAQCGSFVQASLFPARASRGEAAAGRLGQMSSGFVGDVPGRS